MKTRRGFTLVELLVVIGIIALLIAILLPALNKARQAADVTACSSNMRQLAQACFEYQAENNGFFPPAWSWCMDPSTLTNATTSNTIGLTTAQPTCLYGLLTALPPASLVRCCPTVFNSMQDPTIGPGNTNQGYFTYKYSGCIGGVDDYRNPVYFGSGGAETTSVPPGPAVGYPVFGAAPTGYTNLNGSGQPNVFSAGAGVWWPRPLQRVPHPSETVLFEDYPQVQVFAATTSTTPGDNRGFKLMYAMSGPGGYSFTGGWFRSASVLGGPFLLTNPSTKQKHQGIFDCAPVHYLAPSRGVLHPTISDGNGSYQAKTGLIDVCYADGSVHSVTITQGVYSASVTIDVVADPGSGGAGYTQPGTYGVIDGSRYDPTIGP